MLISKRWLVLPAAICVFTGIGFAQGLPRIIGPENIVGNSIDPFSPAAYDVNRLTAFSNNSSYGSQSPTSQSSAPGQSGAPVADSGQEDLVKKALDPTAALMTFGFRNIVTPNYYGRSGSANQIQFQPAVPFVAWGTMNVLRLTLPYNTGGVPGTGLSDVQLFNVTVLPVKGGRMGIGPVFNFVSNPAVRDDRIQAGPAIGYIANQGKWVLGVFNQNLFGSDTRISAFQPAIAFAVGGGWAVAAGDAQWTVDWRSGQFVNIPLGIQVSKVSSIGSQRVRLGFNPEYNARSIYGAPHWSLRFLVQLLVPSS